MFLSEGAPRSIPMDTTMEQTSLVNADKTLMHPVEARELQ